MLPARMRSSVGWSDACILNISSRGLMVHATCSALEDGLVELWHGDHAITARVVWREGARAGLRAEESIPLDAMLGLCPSSMLQPAAREPGVDRKRPRTYEHSRLRARGFEFASAAVIAAVLAFGFSFWVGEALAQPLAAVQAALRG